MLRPTARACPRCSVHSLLGPPSHPSAQQTRPYAQIQRDRAARYVAAAAARGTSSGPRASSGGAGGGGFRADRPRPARMVLSDTVGRPETRSADGIKTNVRKPLDPFGHLNQTKTPPTFFPKERREPRERDARDQRGGRRDEAERTGSHFPSRRKEHDKKTHNRDEPFHALKMQKTLHEVPYGNRVATKKLIQNIDTFEDLPLMDSVQQAVRDALPDLEYRNPTPAQCIAIPALLGQVKRSRTRNPQAPRKLETFLLAAETGSGKTLAYLLPTIDAIKREEAFDAEDKIRDDAERAAEREREQQDDFFSLESPTNTKASDPARPRAVILVPSAELVAQVGAVAKQLSHSCKFRAAPISAKNTATVIRSRLFNENGVDILISTPPLLASIAESNPNILSRVTHLICDEADSLFDRSFKPSTTEILDRATPSLKKLILCSATIPRYLDKYLATRFPDMNRLVTPNLHAIPRRVQLGVVDVNKDPYRGNKKLACADTIWQIGKANGDYDPEEGKESVQTKRILVFVNEREDTDHVASYLASKGIDAVAFHRDTDPTRQAKALASFTGVEKNDKKTGEKANTPDIVPANAAASKRQLANTKVIVTTDLGSRGIDTVAVRHVILYDVPHTTIDFIHRLGRTGRMGRRGRAVVLVGAGDRADVVREVRDAMFRGEALI